MEAEVVFWRSILIPPHSFFALSIVAQLLAKSNNLLLKFFLALQGANQRCVFVFLAACRLCIRLHLGFAVVVDLLAILPHNPVWRRQRRKFCYHEIRAIEAISTSSPYVALQSEIAA